MVSFARQSRTPIGLDIGARSIKAAQLTGRRGQWRIEAAVQMPRLHPDAPFGPDEAHRVGEVLYRKGFVGGQVIVAAPPEGLVAAVVTLPPAESGAPRAQIARAEVARAHGLQADTLEVATWDVPGVASSGQTALAVACRHEPAEALIDTLEAQRLDVAAIDVPWLAAARAVAPLLAASRSPAAMHAMIDLGWRSGHVIVLRDGAIVYERTLPEAALASLWLAMQQQFQLDDESVHYLLSTIGFNDPEAAEAQASDRRTDPSRRGDGERRSAPTGADSAFTEPQHLIGSHVDQVAGELLRSVSYGLQQYGQAELEQTLLIGGGAGIPGIDKRLAAATEMNMRIVRASELVECPSELSAACASPDLTVAIGLAQHGG